MNRSGFSFVSILIITLTSVLAMPGEAKSADKAKIKAAVSKGAKYLQSNVGKTRNGAKSLIALAMIKADVSPEDAGIQEAVNAVLAKIDPQTGYHPLANNFYETGLDAYMLVEATGDKHKDAVEKIIEYIIEEQMPAGAWDYHPEEGKESNGDTSCTHYACLGLWAAQRIGIEFDVSVWENVLRWHIKNQNKDGGYGYCPGFAHGDGKGASIINMTINAICSMQIAAMQIDEKVILSGPEKRSSNPNVKDGDAEANKKFGVLDAVQIDSEPQEKIRLRGVVPSAAYGSTSRAIGWMQSRFFVKGPGSGVMGYYYYSIERMGALANLDTIGNRNWFDECASLILDAQNTDGSWKITKLYSGTEVDTAFCILFLTRSTGKLIKRVDTPQFGDGLLAGGRGLPDDLTDVDFNGRSVKMKEKPTEPLDILLASLSKTGGLENLDAVQKQIVEQVQIGNREDLIGQIDQLLKLVDHPDPTIRQTVVWALGRTGDMKLTQHLIKGLSDTDLGVMIESRNALCWISRKPLGFGFPEDPLIDFSDNASAEQKSAAIAQWHKNVVLTWGDWYLKNRPFEDRGDAFEAELRRKMDKLKYGF